MAAVVSIIGPYAAVEVTVGSLVPFAPLSMVICWFRAQCVPTTQTFSSYTFPDAGSVCLPEFSFAFELAVVDSFIDLDLGDGIVWAPAPA